MGIETSIKLLLSVIIFAAALYLGVNFSLPVAVLVTLVFTFFFAVYLFVGLTWLVGCGVVWKEIFDERKDLHGQEKVRRYAYLLILGLAIMLASIFWPLVFLGLMVWNKITVPTSY